MTSVRLDLEMEGSIDTLRQVAAGRDGWLGMPTPARGAGWLALAAIWCVTATATALRGEEPEGPLIEADGGAAIGFEHLNGMSGKLYFPEMTGQGAALLDYDGDGDLDLYLLQGGTLASESDAADGEGAADVLLRNDLAGSSISWTDVSVRSRLRANGYGMAVGTGDLDRDGWPDLVVANYGSNQLWRNAGNGTFEDLSPALGEPRPQWTTGALFLDYDEDGFEDIYLVNYVEYSVAEAPACYATSSRRDYCGPSAFPSQPDRLLRNLGNGSFEDVSSASGVGSMAGSGLGATVLDADGDGRLEVYVANDGQPNFLWRIDDGEWFDDALLAGVAVNRRGEPEASMGIGVGDFDRDGDEDLYVTHLEGESSTLYVNSGGGLFDDRTVERGLEGPSVPYTAFGVVWLDMEHDGWLDLAVANGAVRIQEDQLAAGESYPLGQANQLFSNLSGSFAEAESKPFSAGSEVSRGLAGGDLDNDGDLDLVLSNNAGPARSFLSRAVRPDNWLGISLSHPAHESIEAVYEASRVLARATTAGSYASASDPRVLLTGSERPSSVTLHRRGRILRLIDPPLGHYLRIGSNR